MKHPVACLVRECEFNFLLHRRDYDEWAELGNEGWSFDDVLPFFKRSESFKGGDTDYRGQDGPMKVSITPHVSK